MIRPPPRSTRTDTLFPYATLFRSGSVSFSGGHEQSVLGVLKGSYDSAFTWTSEGDRFGNIRTMMDKGMLKRDDIRVVWKSDLIANPPIVVRADLPAEMKTDIADTFKTLEGELLEAAAQVEARRCVDVQHELIAPTVEARVDLQQNPPQHPPPA